MTYRVFNGNYAVTRVTDADLDRAASETGPLPTELVNAAARAGRRDLVDRLVETIAGATIRPQALATAEVLLNFGYRPAADVFEAAAPSAVDDVAASIYRLTALRLRGVAELRAVWEQGDHPLCGFVPSLYNGLVPTPEDLDLVASMIDDLARSRPAWLAFEEGWFRGNALDILVELLAKDSTGPALAALDAGSRARLGTALQGVLRPGTGVERSTRTLARQLLAPSAAVPLC